VTARTFHGYEVATLRVRQWACLSAPAVIASWKVVEIVRARSTTFGLVDARELAEELGASTDYVYAHATELGAMRLGAGPKARIRFDLDRARQALENRTRRSIRKHRR
jgi:hypothetical protein